MIIIYIIGFIIASVMALWITPMIKAAAKRIGAVDAPNQRKVHTRIMPRLGGVAIFLAFGIAFFVISPAISGVNSNVAMGLLIGGAVVVATGALDDKYDLSPKLKLLGQVIAAGIVVAFGLKVDLLNVPFGHTSIGIGWLSIPLTIFWIVGVTNAINLIDGLDGLAAGVSGIATVSIFILSLLMGNITVALICAILLGSISGFLVYNFHPAKIFMGDSGALFLGFCLATLSVLGFKQATMMSFIMPLLILGVPLSDTFFAIVRRVADRKPISAADKNHLHHCLLQLGLSHRTTVLLIYGIAALFAASAVLLSQTTLWLTIVIISLMLIVIQISAEAIGVFSGTRKPVIRLMRRMGLSVRSRMTK